MMIHSFKFTKEWMEVFLKIIVTMNLNYIVFILSPSFNLIFSFQKEVDSKLKSNSKIRRNPMVRPIWISQRRVRKMKEKKKKIEKAKRKKSKSNR